ncbi:Immunity protein 41 [Tenacibaculum sp. MAR_2009_124]|uniref:Imm41 family immunity protein n=1 Tax=Tenacibaculum sp. MAR_2009_124 TaxID=1250059 RepID=UPI000898F7A7|nr:Imm41 family immunity protein [Tenacibaculum sp. MAR_2009_124]SEB36749.1 Immunity protein 41 [Tenacibaculum sp. MAR_2009_124]
MKLIDEFDAKEGSFLLELRTDLNWNHRAFLNLLNNLLQECKKTNDHIILNRNIAEGVWYISHFIKNWSTHRNFRKEYSDEYYEKAYELIYDLATYYFSSFSPYTSGDKFETLLEELENLTKKT